VNYKGIYFDDDSGEKFQCPETGAHFEYFDMYRRLQKIKKSREKIDKSESSIENTQKLASKSKAKLQKVVDPEPV
jgi:transcription initiation factor IIE alpha subunit